MRRLFLLLFTLVLMGVLFSCQTTSDYEERSSKGVAVEEGSKPAKVEEEPSKESAKVDDQQVVQEVEDADAEEVVGEVHKPGSQREDWRITRAQVIQNGHVIASSREIPSDYKKLRYLIVASETGAVALDVSETNVARGEYDLIGNKIAVQVEYIDWDVVRMIESHYGVNVQEGLLDAYYFFVQDFNGNTAILKAYAFDRVLSIWATRQ